jgi:tRNA pseudouridine32 synthase/23S rRNA pseudouridine746 synthase
MSGLDALWRIEMTEGKCAAMAEQPATRLRPVYAPPAEPYLDVLYDDADLLVISKQSGLLSVPGRSADLADCVEKRAQSLYRGATSVHRLDLDTSGVMVMARNRAAHRHLSLQFEKRQVSKVYVARVSGTIGDDAGAIDAPLICDWPNRPRQMIDHFQGRATRTAWQVIGRDANSTRVRLLPKTGRSHQLRVHMLSIGHPILGDNLYAHPAALAAAHRLQLHAQSIAFAHPVSGCTLQFQDPCPF